MSKYTVKNWRDNISPSSTFNGDKLTTIRNNDTGETHTGRGRSHSQSYDRAVQKHIDSSKKR